jgi:hypothetical protein
MTDTKQARRGGKPDAFMGVRLPRALQTRIDALAARMDRRAVSRVTRSDVVRLALLRGLDVLEAEDK